MRPCSPWYWYCHQSLHWQETLGSSWLYKVKPCPAWRQLYLITCDCQFVAQHEAWGCHHYTSVQLHLHECQLSPACSLYCHIPTHWWISFQRHGSEQYKRHQSARDTRRFPFFLLRLNEHSSLQWKRFHFGSLSRSLFWHHVSRVWKKTHIYDHIFLYYIDADTHAMVYVNGQRVRTNGSNFADDNLNAFSSMQLFKSWLKLLWIFFPITQSTNKPSLLPMWLDVNLPISNDEIYYKIICNFGAMLP